MRQWIKCYALSFLIILLTELAFAVLIVLVMGDVFRIASAMLFYALRFIKLFLVLILQGLALYQYKKHREVRSKLLVTFTCLYAILFAINYVLILKNRADANFATEYALFLMPLIIQVVIFILLSRKMKRSISESVS